MDAHWIWFLLALGVVAAELATGTIYLLMLAAGLIAAGFAAWAGFGTGAQLLIAAIVTAAGCWGVQRKKATRPAAPQTQRDANVHIDLGNAVQVEHWQDDQTTSVQYRGAQWQARLDSNAASAPCETGKHRIVAVDGNILVLEKIALSPNLADKP